MLALTKIFTLRHYFTVQLFIFFNVTGGKEWPLGAGLLLQLRYLISEYVVVNLTHQWLVAVKLWGSIQILTNSFWTTTFRNMFYQDFIFYVTKFNKVKYKSFFEFIKIGYFYFYITRKKVFGLFIWYFIISIFNS